MKTEVAMQRELFGMPISQKSKSEFFSGTDLVRAGNKWRALNGLPLFNEKQWLKNSSTTDFIKELEAKFGPVKSSKSGRGGHTWLHPLLFIDMALAISPKLKVEVYQWLFDHLIKNRNDSGDSYKLMCGNLYVHSTSKRDFPKFIAGTAKKIKAACSVKDWESATEQQLALRDKIQNNIALLSDVLSSNDEAVRLGIIKSIEHSK